MGPQQALAETGCMESSPEAKLTCDQAIFTSVRTPMGEGYRIISASRGLRPDEKQTITTHSPSHEGLCAATPESDAHVAGVQAVAFYALPSGRLCATVSCFAGAEHTGRGGQRVYTYCIAFNEQDFARVGFNPFNVFRAMIDAGVASPVLKPAPVLEELDLKVSCAVFCAAGLQVHPALSSGPGCYVLRRLLEERSVIVNVKEPWLEAAEVLLFGLPGPIRAKASFAAGMRFSLGRRLHLHLLHDDTGQAKMRIKGQQIEYIDPDTCSDSDKESSAWLSFVDRHWVSGDTTTLARRTSQEFTDTSSPALERIGGLYRLIDEIQNIETNHLLGMAIEHLHMQSDGVEQGIIDELVDKAGRALSQRFAATTWVQLKSHWDIVVSSWKQSEKTAGFVQPLMEQALRTAMRSDPLAAAWAALDIAPNVSTGDAETPLSGLIDEILNRLTSVAKHVKDEEREQIRQVCSRWQRYRSGCPIIDSIFEVLDTQDVPASS
ncbi:MAG: hypothetical protein JSU63_00040 [Phycisphaerales bacterium]|nr:MAG: hypothetical protein JSU63_00040 [Phycisphaerales bacterium]